MTPSPIKEQIDLKEIAIADPGKGLKDEKVKETERLAAWKRPAVKKTRDDLRANRIKAARGF